MGSVPTVVRGPLSPEEAHLEEQERELADLVERLAEREAGHAESVGAFARFRDDFLRRFGPLYAELDRLEAEIARRVAASEGTLDALRRADEAAERASESERAALDAGGASEDSGAWEASDELKALFREAAKLVHPDLATDEGEKARRHRAMAALNAAFADGDAEAMRAIVSDERSRPEAIVGDDVGARLLRTIRRIAQVRARMQAIDAAERTLQDDPVYDLYQGALAAETADPLAGDEADLRRQIASAHIRLAALLTSA
jgi:hypothetical protein